MKKKSTVYITGIFVHWRLTIQVLVSVSDLLNCYLKKKFLHVARMQYKALGAFGDF